MADIAPPAARLSDQLARHVAGIGFAELPQSTVRAAKTVLLDTLGVALAASGLAAEVQPFIELACRSGSGPCTILGTGLTAPPAAAALANGSLVHALDFEDAFDPAPGHPNASLVPALIALAQAGQPVSGREFITALAVGGDLSCRIALALDRPMEAGMWYPPPITAGFGAAAGAARLLGLDADGVRTALSLALCQVTMPGEIKHSRDTTIRAVREAFPAQAAVQSALLALAGVAGFEAPLEGPGGFYALYALGEYDPARLLDDLGQRFWIDELTYKPWPSCRGTHPFIEGALAIRNRGVHPEQVAAIHLVLDPVQQMLVEPAARKAAPAVLIDAKFSILFAVALALVRGEVSLDSFTDHTLRDEQVLQLAARCSYEIAPGEDWQRGSGGRLEVTLHDGTVHEAEVAAALGSPRNPLSQDDLLRKFRDCARRARKPLSAGEVDALAEAVLSLETLDDVGALLA